MRYLVFTLISFSFCLISANYSVESGITSFAYAPSKRYLKHRNPYYVLVFQVETIYPSPIGSCNFKQHGQTTPSTTLALMKRAVLSSVF